MDLLNSALIFGKMYLLTCQFKETKQSFRQFERILFNKYKRNIIFLLNRITSICLEKEGIF